MLVFHPSLRWKIVLPGILTTALAVVSFARYTVDSVSRTLEAREKAHLMATARLVARDSGTLLAAVGQDRSRAVATLDEVLRLTPSVLRLALFLPGQLEPLVEAGPVGSALLPPPTGLVLDNVASWRTKSAEGLVVAAAVHGDTDASAPGQAPRHGQLVMWASRQPIVEAINAYIVAILPVGVALLMLAMSIGFAITTGVLRHLRHLTRSAEALGQGSRVVISLPGRDEIAILARTLNDMSARLEVSRQRIEEQNRTLELKVAARTRELLHAYEELQSLDRAKDSFLSSVSHELRTPLTSIRSFAEILLDYGEDEDPGQRREFLTIIKQETERLSRLINQVLDLAKIEAGVMHWSLSNFDFGELVRTAVRALAGLKLQKKVEFHLDLPAEPLLYFGDSDRLHQVLANLLTNAWKFTPEGEAIRVSLRRTDGAVELRVADRGPGVGGEEEKLRIFDRFRQGVHTLTDKPEGTGLGLPISKEIILMHGGFITVEDNPGGGAVFLCLLPDADPQSPRPIDEAIAEQAAGHADDQPRVHTNIFDTSWQWLAVRGAARGWQ